MRGSLRNLTLFKLQSWGHPHMFLSALQLAYHFQFPLRFMISEWPFVLVDQSVFQIPYISLVNETIQNFYLLMLSSFLHIPWPLPLSHGGVWPADHFI